MVPEAVREMLDSRPSDGDQMIEVLQDVQAVCGYIPEEAVRAVSEKLEVPLIEVCRAASFYKAFSLTPRGKHQITVCTGTACHVRGAPLLLDELEGQLGVKEGGTTDDGLFSLHAVNCLGACALGPVVVLDGKYHDHMTPARTRKLVESVREEERSGQSGPNCDD